MVRWIIYRGLNNYYIDVYSRYLHIYYENGILIGGQYHFLIRRRGYGENMD